MVFPGCLQPLSIFEPWAERLVHFVLNKVHKQRVFALLYTPSATDILAAEEAEQNRVGVLLRVVNAYYPNNPGSRFIVLVKSLHRVEIKSRYDHQALNFPMANVVRYLDHDELEASQVAPELMRQLPALVDDKEAEAEAEPEADPLPQPSSAKEREDSMREARVVLEAFMQRFRFNSMWKVIKRRLGQEDPPYDEPGLLGFWMAATLARAAWIRGDVDKLRLLRERRWEARLRQAVALFKKYPPVRTTLAQSSDAAHLWDRDSAFSLTGHDDEEDTPQASRIVPLKEKCVEFICTDESWKAPHIARKLPALPIEVIERILLYLHRTERLTLEALEFFKAFPVETLFLSNIRAVEDTWLDVLKGYSSLTYLDLSNSYRITDTGLAECLKCMPQLRSLFVDRCKRITDAGLAPLGTHCPNLRRVHVGGTMITYYALAALNSLEDLQDVSVNGTRFPDKALYTLLKRKEAPDSWAEEDYGEVRQLTDFQASRTLVRDDGVRLLKGLGASLHTLNLAFNPGIADWSFLGSLASLTHLDISLNVGFTDQFAADVGKLSSLTLLNLSKTELTDEGIPALMELSQLRSLDVGKTAITHRALGPGLAKLPNLTALSLPYTNVGGKFSRYLTVLHRLTSFKTTGCPRFGNKGLLELAKGRYPHLTALDVGCDQLTDSGLAHIGELAALRNFNMWNTKVTNQGAELVQQLTGLVLDDLMNTSQGTYLFVRK